MTADHRLPWEPLSVSADGRPFGAKFGPSVKVRELVLDADLHAAMLEIVQAAGGLAVFTGQTDLSPPHEEAFYDSFPGTDASNMSFPPRESDQRISDHSVGV